MKKIRLALLASLVIALLLVGSALAQGGIDPTIYEGAATGVDGASSFDPPVSGTEAGSSIIVNGDFSDWSGGQPVGWTLWSEEKSGWEVAHPAQVDLAVGEGMNDALGWFVRNIGGGGSYYAGAYQHLPTDIPAGYYFINVSASVFWGGNTSPYNSIAWYGISDTADPNDVMMWRELYPYSITCAAADGLCTYIGRDETLMLEPGQYFHLMVTHKFPVFNAWSMFIIDDVAAWPANPESEQADDPNGYYDWLDWEEAGADADEKCHWYVEYCWPYWNTLIYVDPNQVE